MEFIPFPTLLPKIAEKEISRVLVENRENLPDGWYVFTPSFCADKKCDCRRAFINVFIFEEEIPQPLKAATISYGWEPRSFYQKWGEGFVDDDQINNLKGPVLEQFQPQSRYAREVLDLFIDGIISNPEYVNHLKRHYVYFKYKRKMKMPTDLLKLINTVGDCPCGSGKIFRMCCGKVRR